MAHGRTRATVTQGLVPEFRERELASRRAANFVRSCGSEDSGRIRLLGNPGNDFGCGKRRRAGVQCSGSGREATAASTLIAAIWHSHAGRGRARGSGTRRAAHVHVFRCGSVVLHRRSVHLHATHLRVVMAVSGLAEATSTDWGRGQSGCQGGEEPPCQD